MLRTSVRSSSTIPGAFSQKSRKSKPRLFLEYNTVKPQIPPDLSHFHMRNDGALCIVDGHFGPKTTP